MRAKIAVWTNREIVSSIMKTIMVTLETLALTDLLAYIEGQTLFKFAIKLSNLIEYHQTSTVKDNPQLSESQGPGTSKLYWRYFEHNKVDRNESKIQQTKIVVTKI